MNETVWIPFILSAAFSPNPAGTTDTITLRVTAVDIFGAEQEEARVSGELYSGEV